MKNKKVNLEMVKLIQGKITGDLEHSASWALFAEKSEWKFALDYTEKDVLNAVNIFGQVLGLYGSSHGIITVKNYRALANKFTALVKEMTGLAPSDDEAQ